MNILKTGSKNFIHIKPFSMAKGSNNRFGFTLMEIMVVVVIIAVLASVAGPMIGDLVNQGRVSATKSNLSALKSALISYKNDVGRFPFHGTAGNARCIQAYCVAKVLAANSVLNVLVNVQTPILGDGETYICGSTEDDKYAAGYGSKGRKWKGPYMDSPPEEFMVDAWGTPLRYVANGHSLILQSAGPDGEFSSTSPEVLVTQKKKEDEEDESADDDIVLTVSRFKRIFN